MCPADSPITVTLNLVSDYCLACRCLPNALASSDLLQSKPRGDTTFVKQASFALYVSRCSFCHIKLHVLPLPPDSNIIWQAMQASIRYVTRGHSAACCIADAWHHHAARQLLSSTVVASSTVVGDHSASGNLSTAASYRAVPGPDQIGVALIDGTAAADNGTAAVRAASSTASQVCIKQPDSIHTDL